MSTSPHTANGSKPPVPPSKDVGPMAPDQSSGTGPATATPTAPKPSRCPGASAPESLPPYNVILLDDDDHTYHYVSQMLQSVFGYPQARGMKIAREVDTQGRAIVLTTHKELAELKRDQILGFGADPQLSTSTGSMRAVIEPAPR